MPGNSQYCELVEIGIILLTSGTTTLSFPPQSIGVSGGNYP
jgi:hypothetical protein